MKEPCRRENLHSIISKISGNVEASHPEEEGTVGEQNNSGNDKADSEMKIADKHLEMTKNMFAKETDAAEIVRNDDDDTIHQGNPQLDRPVGPFSCQLCHVGFLTQRELQLHVMCHGIYITDDMNKVGLNSNISNAPKKSEVADRQNSSVRSIGDKEHSCRTSPVIQKHGEIVSKRESVSDCEEHQPTSPGYNFTGTMIDDHSASEVHVDPLANEDKNGLCNSMTDHIQVNNETNYGRIVDVLSLATATRGFKEPGSIWCSLCKCTVEKGHVCQVHQTSYHAEKSEEGFTCELCGRYYNQKRKLRTHLRNRHKGFRLQEDEGYMCWQCWQAFPEIKILEEHIVAVHGHESRRQNSTWRPFTTPSTLPSPGEPSDHQAAPLQDPGASTPAVPGHVPGEHSATNLKRPGDKITSPHPAKKTFEGAGCEEVLNLGEVNGKVVVNNSFQLTTEVPPCPQTKSPECPTRAVAKAIPESLPELHTNGHGLRTDIANGSDNDLILPGRPHDEDTRRNVPFNKPNNSSNPRSNSVNPSVIHSSNSILSHSKTKTSVAQKSQQCPHCSEKFSKKYILQLHIQQNHGENMHCFFCSISCGTKEALSSHIKNTHTEEVKCGKCPICQCKCLGELHQHIVNNHFKDLLTRRDKDRVLSTCPICHQATADTYHLRWHILKEHSGLQLPREQQEGSPEETSSESGSSVTSEGRLGNEGPERMIGITEGIKGTSGGIVPGVVEEKVRAREEFDQDEVEIVFVSDKNVNCNMSKPPGVKSHRQTSDSVSASAAHCISKELSKTAASAAVHTIKKPADSSGNSADSPKLDYGVRSADHVDSTTGQEVTKAEIDEISTDVPQRTNSLSKKTSLDYSRVSEEACIFCFNTFNDKKSLVSHLQTAHGWVENFTCPICYYRGRNYLNVVEHFCISHFHPIDNTLTQSEVKCIKCDIMFPDITDLKKHSSALHSFQVPSAVTYNTFKCRHCNIIFEKQFDAQKHFDVYHLFRIRYKCETCRMGFTAKYDFQEHVTCNHPELVKSFCPLCGLGFEVNVDLQEHVYEMHRRQAQFSCAKCGNEFGDRFHVHMHIRSNCCVQWADSNFECLDCLTAFSSISELRIHCNQKNCKLGAK